MLTMSKKQKKQCNNLSHHMFFPVSNIIHHKVVTYFWGISFVKTDSAQIYVQP